MTETDDSLRRLVTEELGDCCDGDVAARRERLRSIDERTPDAAAARADQSALRTLADGTRYRLARLLAASAGERCVCELTPLVDVSDSAVSHALTDLADAGLVTRRKAGQWRYYETTDRAEALFDALDATRGEE